MVTQFYDDRCELLFADNIAIYVKVKELLSAIK